jgi:crotonobetainyl-CoA:carnitine CoA-transferase CaiB-like acyl-CoA transferase
VARHSIISLDDAQTGKPVRMASPAGRFSGFKGEVRSLGPLLGEHTDAVLTRLLNYSAAQIQSLRNKGAIK